MQRKYSQQKAAVTTGHTAAMWLIISKMAQMQKAA